MELSPDTENVLAYLESYSEQGLRKRGDLGLLFELTAELGEHDVMNELLFHGAHLYNLYHTLRKAGPNSEGYENLQNEFTSSVERLRHVIAHALVDAPPEQVERFQVTYYEMTQGSLRNLVDLAHDLRVAKQVQNSAKYGEKGSEETNDDV